MRTRLLLTTALLFATAMSAAARAEVGHTFQVTGLTCKSASCHTAEGYQPGLTTIEIEGDLPEYAGYSVRFIVANKRGGRVSLVSDRTVGILSDGHFTASIPAFNYPDGRYVFAFVPKNGNTMLAGGSFTKGGGSASPVSGRNAAPRGGITGEWIGIAGTYGRVRIYGNGTYLFNELPGSYRRSGNTIVFAGPLAVWNGGRATIGNRTIEFYWTTAEGAKQYFVFEKI